MFKNYWIWPSLSPSVFCFFGHGDSNFYKKISTCNYPLIYKGRCLVLISSSVFLYPYFSFSFAILFFLNVTPVDSFFPNMSLTHLRCSPLPFGTAVTLSVALPVDFSFSVFRIYIFGPTGFFLFSTFSIFSRTRFLFYTFLYIRIEFFEKK